jgi:hypothetical protein
MPKLNLLCNQNCGLILTVFGLLFHCCLRALGSPLLVFCSKFIPPLMSAARGFARQMEGDALLIYT